MVESPDTAFDPYLGSPTIPYEILAVERAESPVARAPSGPCLLFSYEDVAAAFRNARGFRRKGAARPKGLDVPVEDQHILELDAPEHSVIRRPFVKNFSPARFKAEEPFIREQVRSLLRPFLAGGGGNVRDAFASPLPARVVSHLLGLPVEQGGQLISSFVKEVVDSSWMTLHRNERGSGYRQGFPEFSDFLEGWIDEHRRATDPPDDLLTDVLNFRHKDGTGFSHDRIRSILISTILGGGETTTGLILLTVMRLAEDDNLYRLCKESPTFIPQLIEECLRLDSPMVWISREATEDIEVHGIRIPAESQVSLLVSAANTDPEVYDSPVTFRLNRDFDTHPHVAFGAGAHACPGSTLARLEAQVVLEELLQATESIELGDDIEWIDGAHLVYPRKLIVRLGLLEEAQSGE